MKMHYDKRNNHIYFDNAYSVKEILKGYGFHYNGMNQIWFKVMPKDFPTLANLLADLTVDCGIDYVDFCEFMSDRLPAEYAEVMMSMDAAHIAKLQAHFCA